jgi:hypothetical protein
MVRYVGYYNLAVRLFFNELIFDFHLRNFIFSVLSFLWFIFLRFYNSPYWPFLCSCLSQNIL